MITAEQVAGWVGLKTPPDDAMQQVVRSVNAYVSGLPVVSSPPATSNGQPLFTEDSSGWDADVHLGAIMLAARYWRRRNSPNGVEAITEAGAQYIARYDSDISRYLKLDMYTKPQIG